MLCCHCPPSRCMSGLSSAASPGRCIACRTFAVPCGLSPPLLCFPGHCCSLLPCPTAALLAGPLLYNAANAVHCVAWPTLTHPSNAATARAHHRGTSASDLRGLPTGRTGGPVHGSNKPRRPPRAPASAFWCSSGTGRCPRDQRVSCGELMPTRRPNSAAVQPRSKSRRRNTARLSCTSMAGAWAACAPPSRAFRISRIPVDPRRPRAEDPPVAAPLRPA